jgi:hypothetical protein
MQKFETSFNKHWGDVFYPTLEEGERRGLRVRTETEGAVRRTTHFC